MRHNDLINPYNVAVSRIVSDVFANDKPYVDFQNPGHTLLPTFPSFRPMGIGGKACLPSDAYNPRTPDYTFYYGVHVCWSEHSDPSFVYGFMCLDYGLGTMTTTTVYSNGKSKALVHQAYLRLRIFIFTKHTYACASLLFIAEISFNLNTSVIIGTPLSMSWKLSNIGGWTYINLRRFLNTNQTELIALISSTTKVTLSFRIPLIILVHISKVGGDIIQLTLAISTSLISNNRLSRSENLVPA